MSKKANKSTTFTKPNLQEKSIDFSDHICTVIITLYLLIEMSPKIEIQDQMGLHWLLIAALNFLSLSYIFSNKNLIDPFQLKSVFRNAISIPYLLFTFISGVSIILALNPVEGLVVYSRVLTTVLAFLVLGVLLFNKLHLIKNIALVITFLALMQGFESVTYFYKNVNKTPIDVLINDLQGTTGNKNVFAAAFIIKLPFIIYCIITRRSLLKVVAILSLFLCLFSVFLINARAAFLGLILELTIITIGMAYLRWKDLKSKKHLFNTSYIIVVLLLSFMVSQHSLKNATKDKSSTYGTVATRLGTLAEQNTSETNIRLAYWKKSIDLIKEKPFIGVGLGNWKLYTPLYTNTILDDNVFSKHPHNDFIEVAGETGVPNALIYLSIFIIAFYLTVKILSSDRSLEAKTIAIITFAALSGYFVDAFFNFPAERPNIQFLFALALALFIVSWRNGKPLFIVSSTNKPLKVFAGLAILLCISTIYVNAMVFNSSRAQYKVDNDLAAIDGIDTAMPKLKYEDVNLMFPEMPNIGENSETIGFKKAKYLQKEKRFDEAIKLLDSVHYQMPNLVYGDYLKCNIYLEKKQLDSAFKYGKKAAYAKPRHFYYFRMASYLARVHKDVKEVQKLFNQYNKYRKDQQSYSYYAESLFYSDYSKTEVKKIVNEGLKLYPTDATMLGLKPYLP
ncbi:O-antigen ligase family protein [Pedobacter cryotolerans]|uniref:O-antigen ligase family protein n=1 Tax=Pedobacter cryotolerans TaxID=2571270 RepID=A0A4U1CBC0_9SPHI|nr:O-antigen ligase family protein [Pedobacter cryotolerans]TKC03228.1 O-antigen ligase family protein [Pedobacter cryotolerans]